MIWESSLSWWFSLGLCHDYHLTQCQDQTVSWAREPLTKSPHWCLDQVSSSVQWNRSCLAAPGENMGWLKTANSSVAVSVIQSCQTLCNPIREKEECRKVQIHRSVHAYTHTSMPGNHSSKQWETFLTEKKSRDESQGYKLNSSFHLIFFLPCQT